MAGKIVIHLAGKHVEHRVLAEADRSDALAQALDLRRQRLALGEFEQVHTRIVRHREHRADGRIEPLRRQDLMRRGADRRIADEPADGIAKAAAGFVARIELRIHHGASLLQSVDGQSQPLGARILREGDAVFALEGAAHGGRIVP